MLEALVDEDANEFALASQLMDTDLGGRASDKSQIELHTHSIKFEVCCLATSLPHTDGQGGVMVTCRPATIDTCPEASYYLVTRNILAS